MGLRPRCFSWQTPWAVLIASLAWALPTLAADVPAKTAPPSAPAAAPAGDTAAKPEASAEKDRSLREQSIYIPYEKLRKVFEKEGRGVFLPYEKFRELWQAAQDKKEAAAEPKPPVGALITEIDNEATVSKDVVRVKAVLKIEVLGEGWQEVPLRLGDSAITEATIGGQPARVVSAGEPGYKLLVEKKGKSPESLELTLHYVKAIARTPGQNSVSFDAPQAPVNRWKVRIPEPGVKVNLHPLIAATEVTGTGAAKKPDAPPAPVEKKPDSPAPKPGEAKPQPAAKPAEAKPEETVVLGFVGAAPNVRIEWTPKAEGATGLEALATVQTEQQLSIQEGVTRTRTQLVYAISRAELRQLAIEIPADQKVANVFDPNVRQWSVETSGQAQRITIQLFEPAKQSQNVLLELEKYTDENKQAVLQAPVVKALGVGRQQGVVVVQVAEGLRADVTRSGGLLQLDAAELPASLKSTAWAFSYRYAAVPYDLQLSVEKVQPRIQVESLVEADLQPERLSLDLFAIYTIQRAGVFRLELDVPAGFEVRQVRGRAIPGVEEIQVDTHHLEGKEKTRLIVNLGRKALGRVGLSVQLQKELREPELLTPTGKAAQVGIGIPSPVAAGVERAAGRLVVSVPESLHVNPGKSEGLRGISFEEAYQGFEPVRQQKGPAWRPVLAFAYTQQPGALTLAAERRKPQVEIRQLLYAQIKEGSVEYRATFFYKVLYSGVKSLRVDVPTELASQIRNVTRTLRERVIDPPPADLPKGYVAWSLTGETELLGEGKFELAWTTNTGKVEVGQSMPVPAPRLKPMDVDRSWGQIVLALNKAETLDLQDDPDRQKGLRPIDPQHDLMPGANAPGGIRAYEFHDDWDLTISATRYRLEEIKHASIERGLVRAVVTRADKIAVQAVYRVRSAESRLLIRLPEDVKIDVLPRINNNPVTLEQGQDPKRDFIVPIPASQTQESESKKPFVLELRYTMAGDGRNVQYPEFPQDPAVQKVHLAVYLPQESVLLGRRGPWTEEYTWHLDDWGNWKPSPNVSDHELISQIAENSELQRQIETFPTDGQMYLFSALQPGSSEEDGLRLTRIHETGLHAVLFVAVIVAGVLLLWVGFAARTVAVAATLILLVLCGVFFPTLSRQVLNSGLAAAMGVVFVVWAGWYFIWTRQRNGVLAAFAPAPTPETPRSESGATTSSEESTGSSEPRHEEGGQDHA